MTMLDVFNQEAFSVTSLTDAINKIKFVPQRIEQMGLFRSTGVATTTIAIEEKDGQLELIGPSPRGGPGVTMDKLKRKIRNLTVPHFEIDDSIMAEEVQGIRAFGQETTTETVQGQVGERLNLHGESLTATQEFSRIGAIKGIVTYDNGDTLNLFDEFDVTQQAIVNWDLDNGSPTAGALRKLCAGVIRTISTELGGIPMGRVHTLCGDNFFDDLIAHTEVRASYLQQVEAQVLRDPYINGDGSSYGIFNFGGITFENYKGSVNGTTYVDTDKAYTFPLAPGIFRTFYSPADYVEAVNTIGQRFYAKQIPMRNDKGIELEIQTNALDICTRPGTLVEGNRT